MLSTGKWPRVTGSNWTGPQVSTFFFTRPLTKFIKKSLCRRCRQHRFFRWKEFDSGKNRPCHRSLKTPITGPDCNQSDQRTVKEHNWWYHSSRNRYLLSRHSTHNFLFLFFFAHSLSLIIFLKIYWNSSRSVAAAAFHWRARSNLLTNTKSLNEPLWLVALQGAIHSGATGSQVLLAVGDGGKWKKKEEKNKNKGFYLTFFVLCVCVCRCVSSEFFAVKPPVHHNVIILSAALVSTTITTTTCAIGMPSSTGVVTESVVLE